MSVQPQAPSFIGPLAAPWIGPDIGDMAPDFDALTK